MNRVLAFVLILFALIVPATFAQESLLAYASVEQDLAVNLFTAFEKETGIKVEFVRLGSGELEARMEAEKNDPQASIWVGGVGTNHISAQMKGLTAPYKSRAAAAIPDKFKDKDGFWVGLYLGPLSITTNLNRAKELGLTPPTSWADLLKPEYKGKFRIAFPGSSGTGYNFLTTVIYLNNMDENKAFDWLKKFADNCEKFERSGPAPINYVATGEIPIAIGYAHDAVRAKAAGAPLLINIPTEGVGFELASMSLIKGGKQAVLAKKLYDWILGPNGQKIVANFFVVPVQEGVEANPNAIPLSRIKTVNQDSLWDASNKSRLQDRFSKEIGNK
ncbi:ABC transporter substrate-binding protein [Treponema sp.]